ncbi:hypothetical protein [Bosea sp. NBC_00550]|uniref:hypothetical protein n=1 Tax=Bosea sp. NBC_00550 TaxID=2969621 RepID=UPI00222F2DC8|nr:hypothetical protein [Bosea sp. NBC_00550]UZF91274.1 hypothetical protein NWE53_19410 [Bosea sp. NBC_00550]UZF92675.1 hypothetical protein NWE53_00145 [Bosea sp. NBC_00550]
MIVPDRIEENVLGLVEAGVGSRKPLGFRFEAWLSPAVPEADRLELVTKYLIKPFIRRMYPGADISVLQRLTRSPDERDEDDRADHDHDSCSDQKAVDSRHLRLGRF